MKTTHKIICSNSNDIKDIANESVALIVTSPPYPMIEMWDEQFSAQNSEIASALTDSDGYKAFRMMHAELDNVWNEMDRILKKGGIACINIGDATRTIDGVFRLYPNHAWIINKFISLGFDNLPNILWRKQTNAPNKFMGSGMLPVGAYVTLEHEYILIFRKGSKRIFKTEEEKNHRQESAFFWEERNNWYSDIWDFKGTKQKMHEDSDRKRSGAFPIELPFRLINMFSVKGDIVVDPFLGTGTTTVAAMASGRNSVGCEVEGPFINTTVNRLSRLDIQEINTINRERLASHIKFISEWERKNQDKPIKHHNTHYNFSVITSQEKQLRLEFVRSIVKTGNLEFETDYQEKYDEYQFTGDELFGA